MISLDGEYPDEPLCGQAALEYWDAAVYPLARAGGACVHTRDCYYLSAPAWPEGLTRDQAEAWLRGSHEHRRCQVCAPDIPEPSWVRVRSPGGQVRWRLADDVDAPLLARTRDDPRP